LQTPVIILQADDDNDDRYFFARALEQISIATHLTSVNNGEQLMEYLHKQIGHLPDVLFLDLNMPRKNGSECLEEIKLDDKLKNIPIVIYSTSVHEGMADYLYKAGAHYYMYKCDFWDLATCIEKILIALAANPTKPSRDKFIIKIKGHSPSL